MALFSDSVDFNAAAFHALVLLARPLGGKEGSLFQGSMINSDILSSDGVGDEMNGIEIMLNAMRRFDSNELLQAKGCWAIVNIALVSTQRTMLLKRGGLSVVTNAMRRHPYDTEVQLRAVSALVNMVKPCKCVSNFTDFYPLLFYVLNNLIKKINSRCHRGRTE